MSSPLLLLRHMGGKTAAAAPVTPSTSCHVTPCLRPGPVDARRFSPPAAGDADGRVWVGEGRYVMRVAGCIFVTF
jgi:hypothetical protein